MKFFTLILVAGALAVAPSASAKKHAPLLPTAKTATVKKAAHMLKATENQLIVPGKETVYIYEDGEWLIDVVMNNTYDAQGNIISMTEDDGAGQKTRLVECTFDSYGNLTSQITSVTTDNGAQWTPQEKRAYEFADPVLHHLTTLMEISYYYNDEWVTGTGNKFEITRNTAGNITNYNVLVLFQGNYDNTVKTTLTYPDGGSSYPESWKLQNLGYDYAAQEYYWEDGAELRDIVWEKCDGQIAVTDYSKLFYDANKIKSATLFNGGEHFADIVAEYPNERDHVITLTYTEDGLTGKETDTLTFTDDFGSYIEKSIAEYTYEVDPEMVEIEGEMAEVIYDNHGNISSETYKFITGEEEELMGKTIYEYTYGDNGEITMMVTSEVDPETEEIIPVQKIEFSDFVNPGANSSIASPVTEGTISVEGNRVIANADGTAVDVYAADGRTIASLTLNAGESIELPAGLYIIRTASTTAKIAIR